ncbi:MAG: glutamine amidotransferase [Gammaproteobacteria bacterium]|nr:glutamine amidotransferase [Gammaproteobacteria bacterium]MCP5196387.1 glutamine amidotransferase [Gammaproteobacteria bacterium]
MRPYSSPRPRLLLVMQTPDADAGRCARKLRKRGYRLDYCYPLSGQSLPSEMDGYLGVIVFGGPMSANDDDKRRGIRAQLDWIPKVLESGQPFLGICLGAQLLARVLGAAVRPHPMGLAEIGYFPVEPTVVGQTLFDAPLHVYHWHHEGFELPAGAELLATGERFPHQAYRYGANAFGVQFHPEVDRTIMESWLVEGAEELRHPGAQSATEQREQHLRHDAALDEWFDRFVDGWF